MSSLPVIAIIGGTGDLGGGLASRLGQAGYPIVIGSRSVERSEAAAAELQRLWAERGAAALPVQAMNNLDAAAAGQIVVLTVPFAHQADTLQQIREAVQGKIVVDATVPLQPPRVGTVQLPAEGSAGQIAQAALGEEVRVVSAFQNVAAAHLQSSEPVDCDVLVTGNDKDARAEVIQLVEACGMRGFHAGPIANAAAAEALTSALITINRQYKCHAGIKLSGLGDAG